MIVVVSTHTQTGSKVLELVLVKISTYLITEYHYGFNQNSLLRKLQNDTYLKFIYGQWVKWESVPALPDFSVTLNVCSQKIQFNYSDKKLYIS